MKKKFLLRIDHLKGALIVLTALLISGCASTSMKIDPEELKDPGVYTSITADSLELLYELDVYGGMPADPFTVKGDVLFISDLSGRVYAYNLKNGERKGIINIKNSSVVSPPLVEGNTVTVAAVLKNRNTTDVLVYDFINNSSVATYSIEDIGVHLFSIKNKPHLICRSGYLYEPGTENKYRLNKGITACYADENFIITAGEGGKLSVTPSENPAGVKEYKIANDIISAISVKNGMIYTVSDDLYLRKTDQETGKVTAERKLGTRSTAAPLVTDGKVIVTDLAGNVMIFADEEDFPLISSQLTGGLITVPPVITGESMIVLNHERKTDILEAAGLKKLFSFTSEGRFITRGLIYNGLFIAGTNKAAVQVFRIRE